MTPVGHGPALSFFFFPILNSFQAKYRKTTQNNRQIPEFLVKYDVSSYTKPIKNRAKAVNVRTNERIMTTDPDRAKQLLEAMGVKELYSGGSSLISMAFRIICF
mmetsp:Transcript_3634/g.5422  ORF Transcript_3634/g.5422 Transcript_3634/m.5422 type:complete len:104 (+) Transcript_3634:200-511(+)